MTAQQSVARRRFLKTAAAAFAAPALVPAAALGRDGQPPSETVAMGFIGLGGHGIGRNLRGFLGNSDNRIVALCDCDANNLARGHKTAVGFLKGAKRTAEADAIFQTPDWRRIIDRPDVDAVMISTPDHWHCLMSVTAIKAGKDVQCEKPPYNIYEGRVLADTVARHRAVFQTSTEDRSVGVYHRLAELVRNGRIGKLQRILVTLPQSPNNPGDPTPKPVPKNLDWDMWLGPAPWTPYCPGRVHFMFRYVADTGTGILTDWGAHLIDTAQWANDTEHTGPISVEGTGTRHATGLYDTFYKYDLTYHYKSGVVLHIKSGGTGIRFEGTDGWLESPSWCARIRASNPDIVAEPIPPGGIHLFLGHGEHRNFLDCVKSREDPYFPAEIGHRCCTVLHLGTICMELKRKLRWDPDAEHFIGDDAAERLTNRAMREPWSL